jgi:hypothetical protein
MVPAFLSPCLATMLLLLRIPRLLNRALRGLFTLALRLISGICDGMKLGIEVKSCSSHENAGQCGEPWFDGCGVGCSESPGRIAEWDSDDFMLSARWGHVVRPAKPSSNGTDLIYFDNSSIQMKGSLSLHMFLTIWIAQQVGSAQVELDIMPCEYGAFWVQPFQAASCSKELWIP